MLVEAGQDDGLLAHVQEVGGVVHLGAQGLEALQAGGGWGRHLLDHPGLAAHPLHELHRVAATGGQESQAANSLRALI